MITEEQVIDALRKVMDPEIHRDIVDLEMVRDVQISDQKVKVTIALTVPNCPLQDSIAQDATQAVEALGDDLSVEITMTAMTPEEKKHLIEKLRGAQQKQPEPLAGQMNKVKAVIAVMSGKGGVGKSTTAALLAAGLRSKGLRVGVLDADITGPSIPKLFGVHETPIGGALGIIPPQSNEGVKIMSINLMLPEEDDAVIWRGPLISSAIQQFWNDVFWGDLDALVVDLPPGTSDAALTVLQSLPVSGCVIVTSPQDLADMVVRKAAKMAERLEIPIIGIIENMSYAVCPHCGEHFEIFGKGESEKMAQTFNTQFLGRMPIDSALTQACDAGKVESYTNPDFDAVVAKVQAAIQ